MIESKVAMIFNLDFIHILGNLNPKQFFARYVAIDNFLMLKIKTKMAIYFVINKSIKIALDEKKGK